MNTTQQQLHVALQRIAELEAEVAKLSRGGEASQGDSKPLIRAVRRLCERIRQAPVDEFLPEFIVVEAMIDASPKNAAPQVPEVREARGDGARVQPPGRSNYEAGEPLSQNTQSATPAGAASRGSSAAPEGKDAD